MQIVFDNYPIIFILKRPTHQIHFLPAHYIFINTWSSKLMWPITTILCVPCTSMWKHFTSSLWMNTTNFIFQLFRIANLLLLTRLISPCSPYPPSINYAHLSSDCVNSSKDCDNTFAACIDFSTDCANKSDDYANTHDDWVNIVIDSTDTLDKSSSDIWISNPSLLQLLLMNLLLICKSKTNVMFTVRSLICFSCFILLHLWFLYFTIFIFLLCTRILRMNSTCALFPIYWHLLFSFLNFRFHEFVRFEFIHIDQHMVSFKLLNCH
jgi:hypothetical protein